MVEETKRGLETIFKHLGYSIDTKSVAIKQEVTDLLSEAIGLPAERQWGWVYTHNIIHGHLPPSRKYAKAVRIVLSRFYDAIQMENASESAIIFTAYDVKPGSLVLTSSRQCPTCKLWFIPTASNQRFHSQGCKRLWEKMEKRQKRLVTHQNSSTSSSGTPMK